MILYGGIAQGHAAQARLCQRGLDLHHRGHRLIGRRVVHAGEGEHLVRIELILLARMAAVMFDSLTRCSMAS